MDVFCPSSPHVQGKAEMSLTHQNLYSATLEVREERVLPQDPDEGNLNRHPALSLLRRRKSYPVAPGPHPAQESVRKTCGDSVVSRLLRKPAGSSEQPGCGGHAAATPPSHAICRNRRHHADQESGDRENSLTASPDIAGVGKKPERLFSEPRLTIRREQLGTQKK